MHEPSRRRLLAGVGAGLLAGCGSPSSDDATPTATPAVPADAPDFWRWLPTPAALAIDPYSLGALDLTALREADLAQRNLNPERYTPGGLNAILGSTTQLLTMSTADVGTGILVGSYDVETLEGRLEDAGFTRTDDGAYSGGDGRIRVGAERVLWANNPDDPAETLAGVRERLEATGEAYVNAAPDLAAVLEAVRDRPATFARPFSSDEAPFETAVFIGTGIGTAEDVVTWRTAITFEGNPPTAARDWYQSEFEDKQGFSNVRTRTREGLLVMDAETSVPWATSTQPI